MLFRPESIEYLKDGHAQGGVLLRSPLFFWFFALLAIVVAAMMLALLAWGTHTQNARVSGKLIWDKEPLSISAPMSGVIEKIHLSEGDKVTSAQTLAVLKSNTEFKEIQSPYSTEVGVIYVREGQVVSAGTPIVTLVPQAGQLLAEFWISPTDIAFIKPKQKVRLRYSAFPHQKFGQFSAEIKDIAKLAQTSPNGSKMYRARAALEQTSVSYFGEQLPLRADMEFDADIGLYRRTLFESMFEPLLAFKGKI